MVESYETDNNDGATAADEEQAKEKTIHDVLMEMYTFRTMSDMKEIYCYDTDKGIYKRGGEIIIEQEAELINPKISTGTINESMNHIRRRTYIDRSERYWESKTSAMYHCQNIVGTIVYRILQKLNVLNQNNRSKKNRIIASSSNQNILTSPTLRTTNSNQT